MLIFKSNKENSCFLKQQSKKEKKIFDSNNIGSKLQYLNYSMNVNEINEEELQ